MRTMKASEFKAKCLQVLDEVQATGMPVQVTKRGKVVAQITATPAEPAEDKWALFQKLFPKSAVTTEDSRLDPSFSIWDEFGGFDAHMERKFGDLWKDKKDAAE
jgi:prevent-host-death family protein